MGALIFAVSVTGIACWISYYYLHIDPDGAYHKPKEKATWGDEGEPETPEEKKDFCD